MWQACKEALMTLKKRKFAKRKNNFNFPILSYEFIFLPTKAWLYTNYN